MTIRRFRTPLVETGVSPNTVDLSPLMPEGIHDFCIVDWSEEADRFVVVELNVSNNFANELLAIPSITEISRL
jgi:hypothetical protein